MRRWNNHTYILTHTHTLAQAHQTNLYEQLIAGDALHRLNQIGLQIKRNLVVFFANFLQTQRKYDEDEEEEEKQTNAKPAHEPMNTNWLRRYDNHT